MIYHVSLLVFSTLFLLLGKFCPAYARLSDRYETHNPAPQTVITSQPPAFLPPAESSSTPPSSGLITAKKQSWWPNPRILVGLGCIVVGSGLWLCADQATQSVWIQYAKDEAKQFIRQVLRFVIWELTITLRQTISRSLHGHLETR